MNNSTGSSGSTGGIGFFGALSLVFIGLKLTGHIDWPWVWVLSPVWITTALCVVGFAIYSIRVHMFTRPRKMKR